LLSHEERTSIRSSEDFFLSDPFRLAARTLEAWKDDADLGTKLTSSVYFSPLTWIFTRKPLGGQAADILDFTGFDLSHPRLVARYSLYQ
jgi:hypothetical protein